MQNLIKAINLAYDEEETRGVVKLRGARPAAHARRASSFIVVSVGLVAVLPVLLDLGLGAVGRIAAQVARWAGLVVFVRRRARGALPLRRPTATTRR